MKHKLIGKPGRIMSFLDIGTNAVRLAIVRFNGRHKYEIICEKRAPARLGAGMYASGRLSAAAIIRTVAACKHFCRTSKILGARKVVAVMTSAGREALNGRTLINSIRRVTGLKPLILSELNEARLIYSGILGSFIHKGKSALVMEIGGGTTEIASGRGRACKVAMALKIGAVRMKHLYPVIGGKRPVAEIAYGKIVDELKTMLRPRLDKFANTRFDLVFGSAGTICSIADIFSRLHDRERSAKKIISFGQVRKTARFLCGLSLAQRKDTLNIQPDRADIIIGGAAILEALMSLLKIKFIRISRSGLREGLILNAQPPFPPGNHSG